MNDQQNLEVMPAANVLAVRGLHVFQAINAVQSAMNKEGISKDRKNQQQGYSFRGIDDCYAAVGPHLAAQKLCIIPRYVTRSVIEHESKSGNALFYVTVEGEFDFVSAVDGSRHTARMFGEAMDSADKATNKAASAAFKYLLLQTFCIPTEGDNDADAHTPEPLARQTPRNTLPATSGRPGPQDAAKRQPEARNTPSDGSLTEDLMLDSYKRVESKAGAPKKWTAWFITFSTDSGQAFEIGTFDAKLAETLDTLAGNVCTVTHRPGKKAQTRELVSIEPAAEAAQDR
jgi:hypothetical protein